MSAAQIAAPPAPKPTLHDIAQMPMTEARAAMQQHYDPSWNPNRSVADVLEDGDRELTQYRVRVNYSTRRDESHVFLVEAANEEEAERLAEALFDDWADSDAEIDWTDVEEIGPVA